MTSQEWHQAEDLFHRALQLDPGERGALLDGCPDWRIRQEVQSLLENAADDDQPINTAVAALAKEFVREGGPTNG